MIKLKTEAITNEYDSLKAVENEWKLLASVGVALKSVSDEDPLQQLLDDSNILENNHRTIEGFLEDFGCVKLENGANCGMEITSITPLAAAGVGEVSELGTTGIVEIMGDNFLDPDATFSGCIKPDDHHVKFRTIDNNWIAPLEGDYLEYSNTAIRVKVPTAGYKDNSQDMYDIPGDLNDAIACTGEVRVCRDGIAGIACGCFVTSNTDVYIPFAANNTFQTNENGCRESVRALLRDLNDAGGYTIRFFPNFKDYTGAVSAFRRAVETWRCATGVNFEIDEVAPPASNAGDCIVRFASLGEGVRGSTAFEVENCGIEPGVEFSASNVGFLISFNSDLDWHTGTGTPNLNWNNPNLGTLEADLESTALHEVGHAHLLLHTCNTHNVMFRSGPMESSTDEYRRELTANDDSGGNHISFLSGFSSSQATAACDGDNMILVEFEDCDITPTFEVDGTPHEFTVFPNPASSIISIHSKSLSSVASYSISIIDARGRAVYERVDFSDSNVTIETGSLPVGTYFIKLVGNNGDSHIISKFIKQ